jgi:hypothetical protein
MRIAALLLIALLATGCAHSTVAVNHGVPPAAAGTTVTSGASGATVSSSSGALVIILLTLGAIEYARNPQPFPSPAALVSPTAPAPELSPERRVNEQDCTKPVDLSAGNLRCK